MVSTLFTPILLAIFALQFAAAPESATKPRTHLERDVYTDKSGMNDPIHVFDRSVDYLVNSPEHPQDRRSYAEILESNAELHIQEMWRRKRQGLSAGHVTATTCPDTDLCRYTIGKGAPSFNMKQCGRVILISPFGLIKQNPSFIKFMAISKDHIPNAWSIPDYDLIPEMIACAKGFLKKPKSTRILLYAVKEQCEIIAEGRLAVRNECLEQLRDMKNVMEVVMKERKYKLFQDDDFVAHFHVPPHFNHLHMHFALSDPRYRKYSKKYWNKVGLKASDVQKELENGLLNFQKGGEIPDEKLYNGLDRIGAFPASSRRNSFSGPFGTGGKNSISESIRTGLHAKGTGRRHSVRDLSASPGNDDGYPELYGRDLFPKDGLELLHEMYQQEDLFELDQEETRLISGQQYAEFDWEEDSLVSGWNDE